MPATRKKRIDKATADLLKHPLRVRTLREDHAALLKERAALAKQVLELQALLHAFERAEGAEGVQTNAHLLATAIEQACELASVRRQARRWKETARMLLDRCRGLAVTCERIKRGGFTSKTLNEIEQEKRDRLAEEERQRELAALRVSGEETHPALAGKLTVRRRKRTNR